VQTSGYRYRNARLIDSYGTVLFPFDAASFVAELDRHDYLLASELVQEGPGLTAQRIEVSGVVARKGDVSVYLNTERHSMGVISRNPAILVEELDPLHAILRENLGLDLTAALRYCEFVASLVVPTQSNPLEGVHRHFGDHPLLRSISEILGTPVAPFGVRLGAALQTPNQVDWTELKVEPVVSAAASQYTVEAIFRRAAVEEVFAFASEFNTILAAVLSALEEAG
jgi:hypothetical protein